MPEPITPTPTPTPAAPTVPVGLATIVGYAFGALNAVAAAVLLALTGLPDDTPTAIVVLTLLVAATGAIVRVNDGRQQQAAAQIAAASTSPARQPVGDDAQPDDQAHPAIDGWDVADPASLPPDEGDQAAHDDPRVPSA